MINVDGPRKISLLKRASIFIWLFMSLSLLATRVAVASPTLEQSYWVEEYASGLNAPRGIVWLPSGEALVTEWGGKIRVMRGGKTVGFLSGVPKVFLGSFHGLHDIELDPDFKSNQQIYLTYTVGDLSQGRNHVFGKVFRARLQGDRLVDGKELFTPRIPNGELIMEDILFLPDKTMLVGVGSGGNWSLSYPQQLDNDSGKVLRLNRDGSIPRDNPFVGKVGALPEIWAYGLRNPSGLARLADGSIWVVDIGPKGGDELNHLSAGGNFGWPLYTWGFDYSGKPMAASTGSDKQDGGPGIIDPALVWVPSQTPSSLVQNRGKRYPFWDGDLFTGGLSGQSVIRIRIRKGAVVLQEKLLADLKERIRTIRLGPDGFLYLLTDGYDDGRILRIRPGAPPAGAHVAQPAAVLPKTASLAPDAFKGQYSAAYHPDEARAKFMMHCGGCHSFGPDENGNIGPNLTTVSNRPSGTLPGYTYSAAFSDPARRINWTDNTLAQFLENPQGMFPGTRMNIPNMQLPDIVAIVNYLTGGSLARGSEGGTNPDAKKQ